MDIYWLSKMHIAIIMLLTHTRPGAGFCYVHSLIYPFYRWWKWGSIRLCLGQGITANNDSWDLNSSSCDPKACVLYSGKMHLWQDSGVGGMWEREKRGNMIVSFRGWWSWLRACWGHELKWETQEGQISFLGAWVWGPESKSLGGLCQHALWMQIWRNWRSQNRKKCQ